MEWLYRFAGSLVTGQFIWLAVVAYLAMPLFGSATVCWSLALWRFSQLKKPRAEPTESSHIPRSVLPLVAAFMAWSITALALFLWLLFVLTKVLVPVYGGAALVVAVPVMFSNLFGNTVDFSITDATIPLLGTLATFMGWYGKWLWQLPPCNRWPMVRFALLGTRETLGAWLIVASWLFLVLLCYSVHADRAVVEQITAAF